ncbi:hypothetical protein RB195_004874 [Necator americanus]
MQQGTILYRCLGPRKQTGKYTSIPVKNNIFQVTLVPWNTTVCPSNDMKIKPNEWLTRAVRGCGRTRRRKNLPKKTPLGHGAFNPESVVRTYEERNSYKSLARAVMRRRGKHFLEQRRPK